MVRKVPINAVWLSLCLLAQVVVTVMPQGAPVCVRSLLAWRPGSSLSVGMVEAASDSCCACCSTKSSAIDQSDEECTLDHAASESSDPDRAPGENPCRDPRCTLCVRAPDAVTAARIVPERPSESLPWFAPVPAAIGSIAEAPISSLHRGRPPPDILGDRARCLVGHVVLLV